MGLVFDWGFGGSTAGCEKKVDVCYLANVTDWGDGCDPRIAVYLLPGSEFGLRGRTRGARAADIQKAPGFREVGLTAWPSSDLGCMKTKSEFSSRSMERIVGELFKQFTNN